MNSTVSDRYQIMLKNWISERDEKGDIHKYIHAGKLSKATIRRDVLNSCSRSVLEDHNPCGRMLLDYTQRLQENGTFDFHTFNKDAQSVREALKRKDVASQKQNNKIIALEQTLATVLAERDQLKEKLAKLEQINLIVSDGKAVW